MINNKTIIQDVINKALLPCTPGELEYHEIATTAGSQSVSFTTDVVGAVQDFVTVIEPKQSGTGDPSPDNVRPISGTDTLTFAHGIITTPPVSPTVISVPLGQTVYGGEVDIDGGGLISNFALVQVKSLNWTAQTSYNRLFTSDLQGLIDTTKLCLCEFAKGYPFDAWSTIPVDTISVASSGNVFFKTTDYKDKDTFLADLGDYYICYPLATPVTAQITPVTVNTLKGKQKIQSSNKFGFSLKYPIMVGGSCDIANQFLPIFYPSGKGVIHNGSTF